MLIEEKFKNYLKERFLDPRVLKKIDILHKQACQDEFYGCLYCKEILEILKVTSQFNCAFKVLSKTQLQNFGFICSSSESIKILAILSSESTTEMTQHKQSLLEIQISNGTDLKFGEFREIILNQYDPILSKSRLYGGIYDYNPIHAKVTRQERINQILDIGNHEWPDNIVEYYENTFCHLENDQRHEEIEKIFPFLQTSTIDEILSSENSTKLFFSAKVALNTFFMKLFEDGVCECDDLELIKTIFKRVSPSELQVLSKSTPETYYLLFCKIIKRNTNGLTFDELIDLLVSDQMTQKI
jgi:hypothetical protein